MIVKISEIPEEGLTMQEDFNPAEMKLDTPPLRFLEPVHVTATFQKQQDVVLVQVGVTGEQERPCGRCLESYARPYDEQFFMDYSVKGKLELDVTDDIRQEIFLTYPVKYLCREECPGLCTRCGANLNQGPCGCKKE